MKLIVVGASGYIGQAVMAAAQRRVSVVGTSSSGVGGLQRLSLEDLNAFDFSLFSPSDVLVLAAAIASPDVCSCDMVRARRINVDGASRVATAAIARGAKVIFLSSDTVYGERPTPFDESAECAPAGDYAHMKHEVEEAFAGNDAFKTVRLSYVFSNHDKFTRYLAGCAASGVQAEIFHPFTRAVVTLHDVAEGLLALALRWQEFPQRVFNFGGPDIVTRVAFAALLKQIAMPRLQFRVVDVSAAFSANRPKEIHMRSTLLPLLLGRPACGLEQAVRQQFASRDSS